LRQRAARRRSRASEEDELTRYVIEPGVALALAERDAQIPGRHRLFAPTLLRSQVLAELFVRVQEGKISRKEAGRQLDYLRNLQVRLLGDRVLQRVAWDIALQLEWKDTFVAEYLALTKLQADALVTMDKSLAAAASKVISVATIEELLS
jgi:predicted nucleic acid-binding protein